MFRPGCYTSPPLDPNKPRLKGIHIGAPACFALEAECKLLHQAFCDTEEPSGIYVVGSVLRRPDWRDVDIRCMLDDKSFYRLFPGSGHHWEFDPRWLTLTVAISEYLAKRTGLPIDFQFQPTSHANRWHKGQRSSIGWVFAKDEDPR